MDVKTVRIREQLGGAPENISTVCFFWKVGKCNRNPCRFMHTELRAPNVYCRNPKQSRSKIEDYSRKSLGYSSKDGVKKKPHHGSQRSLAVTSRSSESEVKRTWKSFHCHIEELPRKRPAAEHLSVSTSGGTVIEDGRPQDTINCVTMDLQRKQLSPSKVLVLSTGDGASEISCAQKIISPESEAMGEKKISLHNKCPGYTSENSLILTAESAAPEDKTFQSSSENASEHTLTTSLVLANGDWFFNLAKLAGHKQAVSGIVLPFGSDKLYSSSSDGTVRVWDCHTGQSTRMINLGEEVYSLITEGPWVFVGIPNLVKAWNIETEVDFSLSGPVGCVYAMVVAIEIDMLFAGAQDGVISAWKGRHGDPNPFQMAASLKGHKGAVLCLAVESKRLCSGSMDGTIRVWDLDSLQCIRMLNGHTDAVISVRFWNQYMFSCSLDQTIKVWVNTEEGNMEVTYTHEEKRGAPALCLIKDSEGKPVLLCSCNNNVVCLYELPTFGERGKIFSKQEVRTMQVGPGGLFFTGDGTGLVSVWKLAESAGPSQVA